MWFAFKIGLRDCDIGLRKCQHLVLTFIFSRKFMIRIFTKHFIQLSGWGIIEKSRTVFKNISSSYFLNALGKFFPFSYDITVLLEN